ncbi:hypothetical protein CMP1-33 [Clavibacter phage CMP1]|uniref:Minor tail protein n=1 Tax=Clavibacter phage CMP1 TaxID=686439 RepID=D0U217_9CAUD|nr:tail protein [Clavibacter phage CMP1]ACY35929.1 hypothetical protein CMP1-33 [Clavibacter phage CMP1]
MGVDLEIGGESEYSASGISVVEDATSVDVANPSGGFGQINFSIPQRFAKTFSGSVKNLGKRLKGKRVRVAESSKGETVGVIRASTYANGRVSVSADARTSELVVRRKAQPHVGTIESALIYYFGLAGVTGNYVIDAAIAKKPVVLRGFDEEIYTFITKRFAPAYQFEVSFVGDNIVARPLRGRVAENYRDSEVSWAQDDGEVARKVEIHYYNNEAREDVLAYPEGGWNEDVQIYQVDAEEIVEMEVELESSLTSITPPVPVDFVDQFDTRSVYSITANDNLPYKAAQWRDGGGRLEVTIGDDSKSLKIKIVGPSDKEHAPYRIAMSSGDESYSSLRIRGAGVFGKDEVLVIETGISQDRAPNEIGVTVENDAISTLEQAQDLAPWVLARYLGYSDTITVKTTGINRKGETGSYRYPTIADFNRENAGRTIAQFNAIWAGKSIGDFNKYQRSLVADDFANQAYGNVAGARVLRDDAWYRISSATSSESGVTYSAAADTTVADFNDIWRGRSIAEFNAEWIGESIADFNVAPLRRYVPDLEYYPVPPIVVPPAPSVPDDPDAPIDYSALNFSFVGDSLAWQWEIWKDMFSELYPSSNFALQATPGYTDAEAAAYQGGVPATLNFSGNQIPAGVLPVFVTPDVNVLASPGRNGVRTATGIVSGIKGTLTSTKTEGSYVHTFTRLESGNAATIPDAGAKFNIGMQLKNRIMFIMTARNSFLTENPDSVISRIKAMMAFNGRNTKDHFVFEIPPKESDLPDTADRIKLDAMNAALKAAFPDNWISSATYLRTLTTLAVAGIAATATDQQNLINKMTFKSFRLDTLHYNRIAYETLLNLVIPGLRLRGYPPITDQPGMGYGRKLFGVDPYGDPTETEEPETGFGTGGFGQGPFGGSVGETITPAGFGEGAYGSGEFGK